MTGWQNDDKTQGKGRMWHVVLCIFFKPPPAKQNIWHLRRPS